MLLDLVGFPESRRQGALAGGTSRRRNPLCHSGSSGTPPPPSESFGADGSLGDVRLRWLSDGRCPHAPLVRCRPQVLGTSRRTCLRTIRECCLIAASCRLKESLRALGWEWCRPRQSR